MKEARESGKSSRRVDEIAVVEEWLLNSRLRQTAQKKIKSVDGSSGQRSDKEEG
jgi:hypothetical protein